MANDHFRSSTPRIGDMAPTNPDASREHPEDSDKGVTMEDGYGWIVVVACLCAQMLCGIIFGYGVFYVALLEDFGMTKWETALAGSISSGFQFGAGTGSSLVIVTTAVMPGYYFERRRKCVMAIVTIGCGIGGLIFPFLIELLIDAYAWRGGMLILGGISLHNVVIGALMRPVKTSQSKEISPERAFKKRLYYIINPRLCRKWSLLVFTIVQAARGFHSFIYYTTLPFRVLSLGLSRAEGAMLVSITGISSTLARFFISIVNQIWSPNNIIIFGASSTFSSVLLLALGFHINNFSVLVIVSFLYGWMLGLPLALLSGISVQLFGLHRVTSAFGYLILGEGAGSLIGPPIAGLLFDVTGNHGVAFFATSSVALVGGLLNIPIHIKHKRTMSRIQECSVYSDNTPIEA